DAGQRHHQYTCQSGAERLPLPGARGAAHGAIGELFGRIAGAVARRAIGHLCGEGFPQRFLDHGHDPCPCSAEAITPATGASTPLPCVPGSTVAGVFSSASAPAVGSPCPTSSTSTSMRASSTVATLARFAATPAIPTTGGGRSGVLMACGVMWTAGTVLGRGGWTAGAVVGRGGWTAGAVLGRG